jgi:hypothetical protein
MCESESLGRFALESVRRYEICLFFSLNFERALYTARKKIKSLLEEKNTFNEPNEINSTKYNIKLNSLFITFVAALLLLNNWVAQHFMHSYHTDAYVCF